MKMQLFLRFILLPAVIAPLCPLVAQKRPRTSGIMAVFTLLIGLLFALSYICEYQGSFFVTDMHEGLLFNVEVFRSDIFSLLMLVGVYIAATAASFFSLYSLPDEKQGNWQALLLLSVAGLCGAVTARDFFTLYVFGEAVAAALCVLIAFEESHHGVEAALKYFLLGVPASALIIFGNALLLLYTGGTEFSRLSAAIASAAGNTAPLAIILGVLACGFMMKAAIAPFHAWKPDACQGAPAPAGALLSGAVVAALGLYPLVRIAMSLRALYPSHAGDCVGAALMFFGMASIIVGALGAFSQRDLRRVFAFAAVSQYGFVALAAGAGTVYAFSGAIYQLFNTMLCLPPLFLLAAVVEREAGCVDLRRLGGLDNKLPLAAVSCAILLLSLVGLPPFAGFWGKLLILSALWKAGAHIYALLALLSCLPLLACFAGVINRVFSSRVELPPPALPLAHGGILLALPAALLALLALAAGLYFPLFFSPLVEQAARAAL